MELRDKAAGHDGARASVNPRCRAAVPVISELATTDTGDPEMRQLYNGAGDGLHRAMEMAIIPPMFGAFGYALDRWLGLLPVLTIIFVVLAVAGLGARMFYAYDAAMKQHEAESAWGPTSGRLA